jgi:outer membrane lipoprotein-sorting protein
MSMGEGNNVMRVLRIGSLVLALLCIVVSHAHADEQLSTVLDGIFNRYGSLKGLSVPYTREYMTKTMAMLGKNAKPEKAAGTIFFKPPNCLELRQTTPGKESLMTDGETIWYYVEAKKTVNEYSAAKAGKVIKLLSDLFGGLSKVKDNFDITQPDLSDTKEYHLKLVPNPAWEEVEHIDLLVARDNFNLHVIEIHDLLGNVTKFTLDEMTIRKNLKKEDFIFKVPAGVKTIKDQQ